MVPGRAEEGPGRQAAWCVVERSSPGEALAAQHATVSAMLVCRDEGAGNVRAGEETHQPDAGDEGRRDDESGSEKREGKERMWWRESVSWTDY